MLRSFFAVLFGCIAAASVVSINEKLAAPRFFSLPADVDTSNMEEIRAALAQMPAEAFALILAGWILGAFMGGVISAMIATRARHVHAAIVGALFLIGPVATMILLPHPNWMRIAGLLSPIPVSLLGASLVSLVIPLPTPPVQESPS